jgi:hypothetical protein
MGKVVFLSNPSWTYFISNFISKGRSILDQRKFERVWFEFKSIWIALTDLNGFKRPALWPGPHVSGAASPVSNPLLSTARPSVAVTGSYRRLAPLFHAPRCETLLRLLHLAHIELRPCSLPIFPPQPRRQEAAGPMLTPLSLALSCPHKNRWAKHHDASLTHACYFLSAPIAGPRCASPELVGALPPFSSSPVRANLRPFSS